MDRGMTMDRRAMVLLPGVLALVLSAALSGVAAESTILPTDTAAATDPFPPVPGLRPQVEFWIEVFTQLRQNDVLLHDTQYPQLRYEVFTLPGTVDEGLSRDQLDFLNERKDRLADRLALIEDKLGRGEPLNEPEQKLLRQLEAAGGRDAIHDAAQRVRSQRGLRERFLEGVRRSGRYEAKMRKILAEENIPPDLAYLPHVESSFNLEARSTAGAAGIWQFTRPTGRRFMHVSAAIDERLDPIAATRAAAVYLRSAHETLGDWALAITAYNHGTTGVLRAFRQHGADLERIVREYRSETFGFASRNFYTEFLAVREILAHPAKYLDAPVKLDAPVHLESLVLPRPATAPRLARLLQTDLDHLAAVNPAWTQKAVRGKVALPADTEVWLPRGTHISRSEIDAQLRVAERHTRTEHTADGQAEGGARTTFYRVRAGDTLGAIASRQGVSLPALRRLNGIRTDRDIIHVGQRLKLPGKGAASHRAQASKPAMHEVRDGENPFVIARRYKISLSSLLAENGLVQDAIIHPGQRLRIPAEATP
jgi:membrane-bound lytic murein transglycosylase D